jgi:undecaprenyl-diphosphatase
LLESTHLAIISHACIIFVDIHWETELSGMILKAVILGIVEGLTEFLPVSSTGHLIITNKFIGFIGKFANLFDIVIQVGAILAVIIYFRKKVVPDISSKASLKDYSLLWLKVIVGFIPAIILGLLFGDLIDQYLFNPTMVAIALIAGAVLLIIAEFTLKNVKITTDKEITFPTAFVVGLFQCLALWPGMSRSASTIIGGLFMKCSREVAAEFSFYLAIPTLLGASLYKILKIDFQISNDEWFALFIGTVVSFVTAFAVIAFFMNYIRKRKLYPFSIYRIVIGIVLLLTI